MRQVKIITDSCADLSVEKMKEYGIDYAAMNTVLDEKTTPAYLDWDREKAHAFYEIIRGGKRIKTTQVPPEEFNRVFGKAVEDGMDIVYIACSSKQSGSVNTAHVLAEKIMKENPGVEIYCIDSLNACTGEGMLAIEAAKMAQAGLSAREIAEKITAMRKDVNEYCTVHSLDALRRAGRVKASAAFFGNLLGVKPIIIADAKGEQFALKKVKGRQNSIREIVRLLKESIQNPQEQTIYVSHGDCSEEEVRFLTDLIRQEIPCKDICVGLIGPIIGASIGPDALAIFGFGNPVTVNGEEKA